MSDALQSPELRTPEFRAYYAHLIEPKGFGKANTGTPKWSLTIPISKSTPEGKKFLGEFLKGLQSMTPAINGGKPVEMGQLKNLFHFPLMDGDAPSNKNADFKGHYYFRASQGATDPSRRPPILDAKTRAILTTKEAVYSGMYMIATVSFWAQNNQYGKAINVNILSGFKTRDGERFSGANRDPMEDYADIAGDAAAGLADDDDPVAAALGL